MFGLKPKKVLPVDFAIDQAFLTLQKFDAQSDEYAAIVRQIGKLNKMKGMRSPDRVSADNLALIVANIVTVLIIVTHEKGHVITTKAGQFLMKSR